MAPTMPRNRQFVLHLGHRTAMGAEDFLVADSNAEAVSWIDRWPDWPAPALTVWGPAGAGKSHLAHVWQARSGAVPAPPAALAEANPVNLLGGRQHLVIDGADKTVDELALLHLYNLLANRGGSLLLTAEERVFFADDVWQLFSFGVAGFVDSGFVWPAGRAVDLGDLRTGIGVSLLVGSHRLASRGGVRFNLGYALDPVEGRDGRPKRWVGAAFSDIDF